ncbi:MAG TPA: deoxyribodipyrimidine photo-lyase [Flavisolibacter sp.]|nr:deoxyribodipyrimidine photo-lyase [Flavisolibacter sp.]
MELAILWFRRDLRLEDNTALQQALASGLPVLPLFIFDDNILKELPGDDARVSFIFHSLQNIHRQLEQKGSTLLCKKGDPLSIWIELINEHDIARVYTNKDYEPYARKRDSDIEILLRKAGISFHSFKDQVMFEESEVLKDDGRPYTVFTPYKNKWMQALEGLGAMKSPNIQWENFYKGQFSMPEISDIGFRESFIKTPAFDLSVLDDYATTRDYPSLPTSHIGPHLRFGTISIRQVVSGLKPKQATYLSELIWREFFMQILFHFPHVVHQNFKEAYNGIEWRNNEAEFEKWCAGQTGYLLVDAGMRQLNATGFMHNRVRMITASFLCKHLLVDWQWGEAYFAKKLLDYELASNNGNWQWAAGTGCDAAPYFRIFNPMTQAKKFDKNGSYIRQWVPELETFGYAEPIVNHEMARTRALNVYKKGLAVIRQ